MLQRLTWTWRIHRCQMEHAKRWCLQIESAHLGWVADTICSPHVEQLLNKKMEGKSLLEVGLPSFCCVSCACNLACNRQIPAIVCKQSCRKILLKPLGIEKMCKILLLLVASVCRRSIFNNNVNSWMNVLMTGLSRRSSTPVTYLASPWDWWNLSWRGTRTNVCWLTNWFLNWVSCRPLDVDLLWELQVQSCDVACAQRPETQKKWR